MKDWLIKKWNQLKGKKRNIGIFMLILLRAANVFFPDALTPEKEDFFRWVIDGLLFGGFFDNLRRSKSTNDFIKNNLIKRKEK